MRDLRGAIVGGGRPRRRLRLLVAMALVLATVVGATGRDHLPRAAATSAAVTWQVHPATKTIDLTVNIAIFVVPPPANAHQQKVLLEAQTRIINGITQAWGNAMFKCFKIVLHLNVRLVSSQREVREDEHPAQLDPGIYPWNQGSSPLRAGVGREKSLLPENYLSDKHQYDPTTGPESRPTNLALVEAGSIYAHEFGHMLGVSDNYDEKKPGRPLRKDAAKDLMYNDRLPVSDATIVKAVRRSGQVDESLIKCPLRIDMEKVSLGAMGYKAEIEIHGCAPDYDPASTDPDRKGKVDFHGDVTVFGDSREGLLIELVGGGSSGTTVDPFTTTWTQGQEAVAVKMRSATITTKVHPRKIPISKDSARLAINGSDLPIGYMTITPYDGPCE